MTHPKLPVSLAHLKKEMRKHIEDEMGEEALNALVAEYEKRLRKAAKGMPTYHKSPAEPQKQEYRCSGCGGVHVQYISDMMVRDGYLAEPPDDWVVLSGTRLCGRCAMLEGVDLEHSSEDIE